MYFGFIEYFFDTFEQKSVHFLSKFIFQRNFINKTTVSKTVTKQNKFNSLHLKIPEEEDQVLDLCLATVVFRYYQTSLIAK